MDQPTLTGRLLVAAPLLQEDSFRRSVVFVVDDADDGTLGVILNRPLDTAVDDVVTDWGTFASEPAVMFFGGPVATESGIALGSAGSAEYFPAGAPLEGVPPESALNGLGVVDLDAPAQLLGGALDALRVFIGYTGWSSGQLAGRSRKAPGTWWTRPPPTCSPQSPRPCGHGCCAGKGDLALLSTYPDDPSMN